MADDARISTAFPRHPKTVKLYRRLKERGCWSLVCLFLWAVDNRPDGDLSRMSTEDIEIAAGWGGKRGAFIEALHEVGFLDGEEGGYAIHDWMEHNPWAANRGKRVECAKRAAAVRWEGREHGLGMRPASDPHAERMRPEQKGNALLSSPLHSTTHTPPNTKPGADAPKRVPRDPVFQRPSLEEVTAYCNERGNSVDPQHWFDHYTANGWKVGGRSPMKDWKASVRTWEHNAKTKSKPNGKHTDLAEQDYTKGLTLQGDGSYRF